jgi:transcriptional regulator with XRE-family HTH domain
MIEEYKDIYITIGENLKAFRKYRNLTQEQLAQKINKLDRSKISDIENAKEDFMFSKILQICTALEIDVTQLLKPIGKKEPNLNI